MRPLVSQILIVAAILLFLVYSFALRTDLRDRVVAAAIVVTGVVLAIHPDLSTRVANTVGIGRGADLLLYLLLLFTLFQNLHLSARLRTIDARITRLVRHA